MSHRGDETARTARSGLVGILAKTTLGFRFPVSSVLLYLGMGWLGVIAARPLMQTLTTHELTWIVAGGLAWREVVRYMVWTLGALLPPQAAPDRPNLSLTAWFSILVVVVLAEVFREGARLRRESELTI
jgi:channel protein (hemolysin III family)